MARERVGIELEGTFDRPRGDAMLRYPELVCAAVLELAPVAGLISAVSIMRLTSTSISPAC
ncbi:MAG: hypothetical protein ACLU37_08050 [Collinsella sp.]